MPLNIPGMPPRTVDVLLEIRARAAEKQEAQKGLELFVFYSVIAAWAFCLESHELKLFWTWRLKCIDIKIIKTPHLL